MKVACVVCHQPFDQAVVEHLAERPPEKRWTCSVVCQKRLELRAERAKTDRQELKAATAAGFQEPEVSEAERARVALSFAEVSKKGGEVVAGVMPAVRPIEYAIAAVHIIKAAAALSDRADQLTLITMAQAFVDRAQQGLEALLGLEPGATQAELAEEVDAAAPRTFKVPSETDPSVVYEVTLGPGAQATCTCPAYQHGRGGPCKHIHAAISYASAKEPGQ